MIEKVEICDGTFQVWDRGDRRAQISTTIEPRLLSGRMLADQDKALGRQPIIPFESFVTVASAVIGFVVTNPEFDANQSYPDCCYGSAFPGKVSAGSGPLQRIDGALVADLAELERLIGALPPAV